MFPTPESDGRPKQASKVPMKRLKGQLSYDDVKWNTLRDFTHTALASARLNWRLSWKAQWPDKIAMVYNVIKEVFPLALQCWKNHKNYHSCVRKPTTYCRRQAAAHHAARAAADTTAQTPSPSPSPNPTVHPRSDSPSTGPSHPHRFHPLRVDSNDANHQDEDSEGVYYDNGDGPEEEEEDAPQLSEKATGKHRAPSQGSIQRKHHHCA
ncbi:hypothetical protein B0H14DRAFT_2612421 [Mycena olivaceomarginata]|nr:hypothetical protein B0H14DRAFT_2612421 [Mycena olivaceomarginata]